MRSTQTASSGLVVSVACGVAVAFAACAPIRSPGAGDQPDGGDVANRVVDAASDATAGIDRFVGLDRTPSVIDAEAPRCGNGAREPGEACDDGNARSGDGCAADCGVIEADFACPEAGRLCVYQVRCGDGKLGRNELCDPPSVGNGCSATCQLEPGFVCDPPASGGGAGQPARCHRTTCGDNVREGTEACDDGNVVDGDGCSAGCSLEPDCSSGTCASKCGDAVKLPPESCDDGNTKDGDGCSGTCQVEMGFSCRDATPAPPERLNLKVTYRDFISLPVSGAQRHADFELFEGDGVTPGLVKPLAAADGKPELDGRCTMAGVTAQCPYGRQVTSAASFSEWYRDVAGVNMRVNGALALPRAADGSYVYDSANRGFYPIDGGGWLAAPAREMLGTADGTVNDGGRHNFGFTTEIRYFFQYRGGESLAFSGDDDVWIFINRRLALDLGGTHARLEQRLNLDMAAAMLGLTRGGLYEIALFHAERKTAGSNFKLTLTGFTPTSSACASQCGDGVKAQTEQCDDGNNTDGDGCSADCRFEVVVVE